MVSYDDLRDLKIDEDSLRYEKYHRGMDVAGFDCDEQGLNDFLRDPREVAAYQEAGLGTTTLVYCHGLLVGFFTLGNDGLEIKYIDDRRLAGKVNRRQKEIVKTVPAIKIGRFAVDKRLHGKGIGTHMMRYIVGLALAQRERGVAVRLLILEAYPRAQPFYTRLRFLFTSEKGRERNKRNRTMYLDLDTLGEVD